MKKSDLNKKQKREALLNTAFELFTSQGLNKTTINNIVEAAGVAKGTFYLYFRDKYDIRNKLIAHKATHIFSVAEELSDEALLQLNMLLNTHLNGLSMEEINLGLIAAIKQQAGIHSDLVSGVIDAVAEAIKADDDLEIYTSGANNIFRYPELADQERASGLINAFEEKKLLTGLVQDDSAENGHTDIQVYIGGETPVQGMKDCSVVTATYELSEGMRGTIGIIGPKRMDYDKVIGTLKTLRSRLDELYKDDGGDWKGKG